MFCRRYTVKINHNHKYTQNGHRYVYTTRVYTMSYMYTLHDMYINYYDDDIVPLLRMTTLVLY